MMMSKLMFGSTLCGVYGGLGFNSWPGWNLVQDFCSTCTP